MRARSTGATRVTVLAVSAAVVVSLASAGTGRAQAGIETSSDIVCNPPVVTVVSGLGKQSNPKDATERCTVDVADQDGLTPPSGDVTVRSTGSGSFDGQTAAGPGCALAAAAPPNATCKVNYTPGDSDNGIVTLSASYLGSSEFMPSKSVTTSFDVKQIVHAIPGVTISTAHLQSADREIQAVALGARNTTSPFPSPIAKLSLKIAAPLSLGQTSQVFSHLTVLGATSSHSKYRPAPHRSLEQGLHMIMVSPIEHWVDLKLELSDSAIQLSSSAARALRDGHRVSVVLTVTAVNMAGDVGQKRFRIPLSPTQ